MNTKRKLNINKIENENKEQIPNPKFQPELLFLVHRKFIGKYKSNVFVFDHFSTF